jgi:hypothetical protein
MLSIEENIDMLVEHEMDMQDEEIKAEQAHIAKSGTRALQHRHRSSKSDSDEGRLIKCHLWDGDHAFRFCGHVKLAGKLLKQYLREQKNSHHSGKKISSRTDRKQPTRKTHGYKAAASSPVNDSETLPNNTTSDDDNEIQEVCNLSHDDISKATPFSWPADTGGSSHMSDQSSIFRRTIPVKRRGIQVGGGVLYSAGKGTVNLNCKDGSSMVLKNVLYVPKLVANLLSARRLCEAGLVGSFNSGNMYFKLNGKTVTKATMENGLYIVNHVSKTYKETAIPSVDDNMNASNQQLRMTASSRQGGGLNQSAKDRYFLFHRRFAHLGPKKISKLHTMMTLDQPFKISRYVMYVLSRR